MKVYWGNHGGWRWAWGLEVWRLYFAIGSSKYPEYITPREMLINLLRLTRWPGGGVIMFHAPIRNGFYMQAGMNHGSTVVTASTEGRK